jgi:EAL domain-containing protein (putative c-di-GMP-specific phosphodiesterase class I)
MGCDELQGFLFFEALPAAQAGALLARRARGKPLRRRS